MSGNPPVGWAGAGFIPAPTKADQAYHTIRKRILDGQLAAGDVLDQETLASMLSLSTTPVREALRRLESERLVISRAHRSTEVAGVSFERLEQTYAIRIVLDSMAAELAAKAATDEQIKEMQTALKLPRVKDDPLARLQKNRAFHRSIYASCGNEMLVDILDSLWDVSDRFRLVVIKNAPASEAALSEHGDILSAIERRDSRLAGRLMRDHLETSQATIRRLVAEQAPGSTKAATR